MIARQFRTMVTMGRRAGTSSDIVVQGTLADDAHAAGIRVQIELSGSSVRVSNGGEQWKVPARSVQVYSVDPQQFRLNLEGTTYVFRPDDAVRMRLEFEPALASVRRSPVGRRSTTRVRAPRSVTPAPRAAAARPATTDIAREVPASAHVTPPAPVEPPAVPEVSVGVVREPVVATRPEAPTPAPPVVEAVRRPEPADEITDTPAVTSVAGEPAPSKAPRSAARRRPVEEGRVVQRYAPNTGLRRELAVLGDDLVTLLGPIGRSVSARRRRAKADGSAVGASVGRIRDVVNRREPESATQSCDTSHDWMALPSDSGFSGERCRRCDEVRIDDREPDTRELVQVDLPTDSEAEARARRMVSHRGTRPTTELLDEIAQVARDIA